MIANAYPNPEFPNKKNEIFNDSTCKYMSFIHNSKPSFQNIIKKHLGNNFVQ